MRSRASGMRLWAAMMAGLVVPGVLLAGFAVIEASGLPGQLAAEETRAAEAGLAALRARFTARLVAGGEHSTQAGFRLRLEDGGTFLPTPPWLVQPPAEVRDVVLAAALRHAARGEHDRALRYFAVLEKEGRERMPAEAVLALARSQQALGRGEEACSLLAQAEATHGRATVDGLPFVLLARLLAAEIAAEGGDPSLAAALRRQLVGGGIALPASAARPVLIRLERYLNASEPGRAAFLAASEVFLLHERGELALDEAMTATPAGDVVIPVGEGECLVLDRDHVRRLAEESLAQIAAPLDLRMGAIAGALAVARLEPLPTAISALPRGMPPSARLRLVGRSLLAAALLAFLVGNLWMFRVARREVALVRLKSDFVDVVSHELRTPLAALSLKAEMLADGDVPRGKERSYLRALYADVRKLGDLVHRILDFARLERGHLPLACEPLPARRLLALSVREGREAMRHFGQRLELDVERDLPELEVDAEVLVRALRNLLENAAKYSPPGSTIRIAAARAGGHVEIKVADAGPGVAAAERRVIFEPFRRGSHPRSGGVGLGLALAERAVRAHHGSIAVEDGERGGAVFTVSLPLARDRRSA